MADSVSTSSGVDDIDVEKIGSDDEEGASYKQEYIEEGPTQAYNLEGAEDGNELQPLQLEEEEEEESEGEDEEEQEEVGEGIDLQALGEVLRVDVDVLLGVNQYFPHVLANLEQILNEKSREVTEYESIMQKFSDNLTNAEQTRLVKDNEIAMLQAQLDEKVIAQREAEQTLASYGVIENELKELSERQEKKIREMNELVQLRDQEIAKHVASKDQLMSQLTETTKDLELKSARLSEMEALLSESQEKVRDLSIPPPDVPGADRQELLRLLDRRQHEITRLSDEWRTLSSKLEITAAKKSEFQTKLDDLASQEASLRLKEQLLQQEKQLVESQNRWLSDELEAKSTQLLELRKEKANTVAELEGKLNSSQEEVKHMTSMVEGLQKSSSALEAKAEDYLKKLKEGREEQATLEEQLRKELAQQAKLSELYCKSNEDAERRVNELMEGVQQLQSLVEESTQEREQLQTQLDEETIRHQSAERDMSSELEQLKRELTHANELLTSMRQKRSSSLIEGEVLSLSPAAAKASAMLKSGLTLTQIYSNYVEATEELQQQKDENVSLNNYIEQIMQELNDKTPALQQLRRDYDATMQNNTQLSQKLNGLFEECESLRLESEDSIKQAKVKERENQRLRQLSADLGRQVKVLLKECEEARGGVASTSLLSHDLSHDISSGDISSSSQVISEHLVDFKSIEELQEQNQRLLQVVRDLSEQNEERERQTIEEQTQELRSQLDASLREIDELHKARDRQKEMVQAIVNQRDMYRTLLAQNTPLPGDSPSSRGPRRSSGGLSMFVETDSVSGDGGGGEGESEAAKELKETKEQFEVYKKEKAENDKILQQQLEEMREQTSTMRLDNAKLSSKLEYANERYQLLETHHSSLRSELDQLRERNQQVSDNRAKVEVSLSKATQQLFTLQERLSKAELSVQNLRTERDLLRSGEQQARSQYEELLREQRGQNVLLTNLQAIQNNLERGEFETRTRLGAQIEALERELALQKERLQSEEDRRTRVTEAYDTQVRDLEQKLSASREDLSDIKDKLKGSEEQCSSFQAELNTAKAELEEKLKELQETKDRVFSLEQDAAGEFRGKIRLLERQLADQKGKVHSLEEQLETAKQHGEQYREMSEAYEQQLTELNRTSEEFKERTETAQAAAKAMEEQLHQKVEELETAKKEVEESLESHLEEASQQVTLLQQRINAAETDNSHLQLELTSLKEELSVAQGDIRRYSEDATQTQELYQHELMQHSKSVQSLVEIKEKLKLSEEELSGLKLERQQLSEQQVLSQEALEQTTTQFKTQCGHLEDRVSELTQQNAAVHEEAEKLSARLLTLQHQTGEGVATMLTDTPTSSDKSAEQLWEIIKYVRREKEIAETKRDLAESENTRHKQLVEHLQRQLDEAKQQLSEVNEAARLHSETDAQHAEILKKVENLNVLSDSNKLLREEKRAQEEKLSALERQCEQLEGEIDPLKENIKQLTAQKDALVAEKTALRNEVQRWSTRTNQLIEQYNKIDPDEYKKLVDERDSTTKKVEELERECCSLQSQLSESQAAREKVEEERKELESKTTEEKELREQRDSEVQRLEGEITSKMEDIQAKDKLIQKLREVGRKFRSLNDSSKKDCEKLKEQLKEKEERISSLENLEKENEELKKKIEEAPAQSAAPASSEQEEKIKELEASVKQYQEKQAKLVKTVKAARSRIQELNADKDQSSNELKDAKAQNDKLSSELESTKQHNKELQEKSAKDKAEMKKMEATMTRQQQLLKERPLRRKAVAPSISEGSSSSLTLSQTTAPTAAIKPTVTTTPTASIRPMAIQTTSAPTAHVTPTMVTTQHVIPSSSSTSASQLTNQISSSTGASAAAAATVFVRSTSPQVVAPLPSTTTATRAIRAASQGGVASGSGLGEEPNSRGTIKRRREEESVQQVEPGSSSVTEPPARKKAKPLQQAQVAASTSLAPDTQGEGGEGMDTQPTEVQALPTEGGPRDQPSASIQPMEDVSGGAAQSAEAQKMLIGESGAGVTSQAGQGTQPVVSSEVQPQQLSTVTQSGEDNQNMEEGVVASQPQTTISSEADIGRQQRGSQEPSSEFARHISPLDSAGDVVAESNNQASVTAVHVDSSESLLIENITQSTSVPSQSQGEEEEEEGEGEGERREMEEGKGATLVNVVVGVVEPERANQLPKLEEHPQIQAHPEPQQLQLQLQIEQKEQEQLEPVAEMVEGGEEEEEGEEEDREAIGDIREGETTEEEEGEGDGEEVGVMEHAGEGSHVKDATREQADTTQKLEEEPRGIADQPVSEPEPISQGEEDGEVEGGGEPEQVSEPLETAVDDGSAEQSEELEPLSQESQSENQEKKEDGEEEQTIQGEVAEESDDSDEEEMEEEEEKEEEEEEEELQPPILVPDFQGTQDSPIVIADSDSEDGNSEEEEEEESESEEEEEEEEEDDVVRFAVSDDNISGYEDEGDEGESHDQGAGSHDPLEQQSSSRPVPSLSNQESESSMGLPEDEASMDIPVPLPSRPTSFPSVRRQQRVQQFASERSIVTPAAFEPLGPEDGVVPHTPVLEGKQLPMGSQTIPSTPLDPTSSAVPQLAMTMQATGAMQSLGETQIDLGAPALVPPPTSSLMVEQSHDQRSHSPLVGLEGDINDAVIDNIVEEESSNGDEEEGDDLEEGELDEETQQGGQPAQPSVTSESSVALSAPIPTLTSTTAAVAIGQQQQSQSQSSSTSAATSAAMGQTSGEERSIEESQPPSGSGAGQATGAPAKIQPIVWESSSSSTSAAGRPPPRKILRRAGQGQGQQQGQGTGRRNIRLKHPRK